MLSTYDDDDATRAGKRAAGAGNNNHNNHNSWISKIPYNESNFSVINDRLVDPQGLTLDPMREVLYFASHGAFEVARVNYDGSGYRPVFGVRACVSGARGRIFGESCMHVHAKVLE